MPDAFTVATDVGLLVHVPPDAPSVSVVEVPVQRLLAPLIAGTAGADETVIASVADLEPQVLVTV